MPREITLRIVGDTATKSRRRAGVVGEGNVTSLICTFDSGWDGYAKSLTFWDAEYANPVKILLTEAVRTAERQYTVLIPAEPLAKAGACYLVVDGASESGRARTVTVEFDVDDAPVAEDAAMPGAVTPTQAEQLSVAITAVGGKAEAAEATANNAKRIAEEAKELAESGGDGGLIVGTEVGTKCAEFSAKLNNTGKAESFVFFTDPHLLDGKFSESKMHEYLQTVKQYTKCTPTSFVMCGGDWIGNSDTQDEACFKLGYLDGYCRALFDPYYPVVGNHDLNYQGKLDADSAVGTGTLTNETIRNLMLRGEEHLYYAFDGASTRFYVLDTGSDWESSMTDYRWAQIAWLADKLANEDKEFSAIAMHITHVSNGNGFGLSTFASNVMSLISAYNKHKKVTLNGTEYGFSNCAGMVKFVISGHTHEDMVGTVDNIPIIVTTQLKDGNAPSFDLCVADYDSNVMHLVRVGTGESRDVELAFDEGASLVMTPGFCFSGFYYVSYPARLGVCTTEPVPETIPALTSGSGVVGEYYPVAFEDKKRTFVVNCPSNIVWAVRYVYINGSGVWANYIDTGWQTGDKYESKGTYPTHYLLQFKTSDDSIFPDDISGISWEIV